MVETGNIEKAIAMFTDLRRWEEAKKIANKASGGLASNTEKLVLQQAQWAEEVHDYRAAAEMYRAIGNNAKAAKIYGEQGWFDDLADLLG